MLDECIGHAEEPEPQRVFDPVEGLDHGRAHPSVDAAVLDHHEASPACFYHITHGLYIQGLRVHEVNYRHPLEVGDRLEGGIDQRACAQHGQPAALA